LIDAVTKYNSATVYLVSVSSVTTYVFYLRDTVSYQLLDVIQFEIIFHVLRVL